MEDKKAVPFFHDYDCRLIKLVRQIRDLSLVEFSRFMGVDPATVSRLENNTLNFSILYQTKFDDALRRLDITKMEMESLTVLLEKGKNDDYNRP